MTSDIDISFESITNQNIEWVEKLRGKEFNSQFKNQLLYGDFGYCANGGEKLWLAMYLSEIVQNQLKSN